MRKKWPSRTSTSSQKINRWLWRRDAKPGATWVFPNPLSYVAGPVYLLLLPRLCRETNGVTLVGADAESGCRHLFLLSGIFSWFGDWLVSTYYVTVSPCFYCGMAWVQRVHPILARQQQTGRHMFLFVVSSLYIHILFADFISMQHSLKKKKKLVCSVRLSLF